ncbi:MAG: anhydro-N-acetylmuramic acid kinase [Pseudarcicella sp.]|nr:anhydro-N-acetylmuramic acid kinase [Pseudarcicella sp.]
MNPSIEKLYHIAQKPTKIIIGLMSGTSLDGLDIALCEISGNGTNTSAKIIHFETVPYGNDFKTPIRKVFAQTTVDLKLLAQLNEWIALQHADFIKQTLKKWDYTIEKVDIVASHGQTVMHAPQKLEPNNIYPNATLQIGDGDHLAVATGLITLSDFRQKNIAGGGEGAPLAVYGDYFLFSDKNEDRILLNIGGIANFTYLPSNNDISKVKVTDTGTGNTLIDSIVRKNYPELSFDKDAAIALSGKCSEALLNAMLDDDFFKKNYPKSTGPEYFNAEFIEKYQKTSNTTSISIPDLICTLTHFSAKSIAKAINECLASNTSNTSIYLSGGGVHNPLMVDLLRKLLPKIKVSTTQELGLNADAKEAVLFAVLANETLSGGFCKLQLQNGHTPDVLMGKISLPD